MVNHLDPKFTKPNSFTFHESTTGYITGHEQLLYIFTYSSL